MGLRHNMSEKESIGKNNKNAGMLPICKAGRRSGRARRRVWSAAMTDPHLMEHVEARGGCGQAGVRLILPAKEQLVVAGLREALARYARAGAVALVLDVELVQGLVLPITLTALSRDGGTKSMSLSKNNKGLQRRGKREMGKG